MNAIKTIHVPVVEADGRVTTTNFLRLEMSEPFLPGTTLRDVGATTMENPQQEVATHES